MKSGMKRYAILIPALILLLALLSTGVLAAEEVDSGECGAEGDNLVWTLDADGVLTVSGSGDMADFVSNAPPWYTYRTSITALRLAEGITGIGRSAFMRCPELTSVTIPASVTAIRSAAFYNCTKLACVEILGPVTMIGGSAFQRCSSLTEFTIPDTVTRIDYSAFMDCEGLRSITIPESVEMLDIEVFQNCTGLTSATILGPVTTLDDNVFDGCGSLAEIVIPATVTSIGSYAFNGCGSLTGITLPEGLTSIGDNAFFGCDSLTDITLPEGLTSIGGNAFNGCDSLTDITLPASLTNLTSPAFGGCDSLMGIYTAPDSTAFRSLDGVLFSADGKQLICFPGGRQGGYTVPDGVTALSAMSFLACGGLTELTIPESVTSIGMYAFYACSGLTQVYYDGTAAQWTEIQDGGSNDALTAAALHCKACVTFDRNADDGAGAMDAQACYTGTPAALIPCAFTREGYAFTGWNSEPDGSGTAYGDGAEVTLSADLTLYAQWERLSTEILSVEDSEAGGSPECRAAIRCAEANAVAYAARYDALGRLLGVESMVLQPGDNEFTVLRGSADVVRFYVLDGLTWAPLCTAVTV